MPPAFKFTRNEITEHALELVRENGIGGLTARALAERLGTSSKPIFGLFSNMDELKGEVISHAVNIYEGYLSESIESKEYPPYKASGIGYIKFAKNEKELFKLLFMRDRNGEISASEEESTDNVIKILMKTLSLSEEKAKLFHLESWIYVHGIASMIATSYIDWDLNFASEALTDMFVGLRHRYIGEIGETKK